MTSRVWPIPTQSACIAPRCRFRGFRRAAKPPAVYVIWREVALDTVECLYVGMTMRSVATRIKTHLGRGPDNLRIETSCPLHVEAWERICPCMVRWLEAGLIDRWRPKLNRQNHRPLTDMHRACEEWLARSVPEALRAQSWRRERFAV